MIGVVALDEMVNTIIMCLGVIVQHYKGFHAGDIEWDAERYFKLENYSEFIDDIIIIATAYALHLNLLIYKKGPNSN